MASQAKKDSKRRVRQATSSPIKSQTGIYPDYRNWEEEQFGHLLEFSTFRSEFPYGIDFSSSWTDIGQYEARMRPLSRRIRFYEIFSQALYAIAEVTNENSWYKKAELAKERAGRLNRNAFSMLGHKLPPKGIRIFVQRDLWIVRKRLEAELKSVIEKAKELPIEHPLHIHRLLLGDAIRFTNLPFSSYPSYLDEAKRGSLFVESENLAYVAPTLYYHTSFEDEYRGVINEVFAYEDGAQGSGRWRFFCFLSDVAHWWTWDDEHGRTIPKERGPAYLEDPVPGLDRSCRPGTETPICATILGMEIPGTFDGWSNSIISERTGVKFPFWLATDWYRYRKATQWTRARNSGKYEGPFKYLSGPSAWKDLPMAEHGNLESESETLRHFFELEELAQLNEQTKENEEQLNMEICKTVEALKAGKSEEHEMQILTEFRDQGIWNDPNTDEEHNSFKIGFPLHATYVAWIDGQMAQRERAVAKRYELKSKYEARNESIPETVPGTGAPKRSKAPSPELFPYTTNDLAKLLKPLGYSEQRIRQRVVRGNPKKRKITTTEIETVNVKSKLFGPRNRRFHRESYDELKAIVRAKLKDNASWMNPLSQR